MSKKLFNVRRLAFCAMAIALATILSYIKLFSFPTGGSLTLFSMFAIVLPGYFFGIPVGIVTAIGYGILQFILEPFFLTPMQVAIDYIFAFGSLGVAGIFKRSKSFPLIKGYVLAVALRYIFSVISGYVYFGEYAWEGYSALSYSLIYNGIYIFSEAAITIVVLLIPTVNNTVNRIDAMANR